MTVYYGEHTQFNGNKEQARLDRLRAKGAPKDSKFIFEALVKSIKSPSLNGTPAKIEKVDITNMK